jgi:hypothetical protein
MAAPRGSPIADTTAAAPMLRRVRELESYTIGATDGDIGRITDLYFDDHSWTIRSFVSIPYLAGPSLSPSAR